MHPDVGGFCNWDICRLILASLPAGSLLQMACVSKSLAEEAFRERLARPIRLRTYEQLKSFYNFVFSGHSARLLASLYVRTLVLDMPCYAGSGPSTISRGELAQLVDVFKNLEHLEILECDWLLLEDPQLSVVVASFTTLRSLNIGWIQVMRFPSEAHVAFVNMFATMRSTLDSLRLPLDHTWIPTDQAGATFLQGLATIQTRLRELSLSTSRLPSLDIPFASVARLDLKLAREYPRVRNIYRAFPNARDISIRGKSSIPMLSLELTEAEIEARRLVEEDCRHGDVWRSLDVLTTSFEYLSVFAITCPVRRLVSTDSRLGTWFWGDHGVELLSRLRPRQLDIAIDCHGPLEESRAPLYSRIFVNESASGSSAYKVAHLFARMWYRSSPGYTMPDTRAVIDVLRRLLSVSQVKLLHIGLYDPSIDGEPEYHPLSARATMLFREKLVRWMAGIDLSAVVRAVVDFCPSLRIVVINPSINPDDRYWKINRTGELVEIEEVGPYAGREMVAREEARLLRLWQ
ncbi:hypothetical protein C8Q70DRAFT_936307 [Cubamyces menziesii]|nr:hypothetical protein C8Q70DRAFT_936307 [Cubamyces menziesii]